MHRAGRSGDFGAVNRPVISNPGQLIYKGQVMTQSKPKGTKTERLAEQRFRRSLRMLENDDIMDDYLDRNPKDPDHQSDECRVG